MGLSTPVLCWLIVKRTDNQDIGRRQLTPFNSLLCSPITPLSHMMLDMKRQNLRRSGSTLRQPGIESDAILQTMGGNITFRSSHNCSLQPTGWWRRCIWAIRLWSGGCRRRRSYQLEQCADGCGDTMPCSTSTDTSSPPSHPAKD